MYYAELAYRATFLHLLTARHCKLLSLLYPYRAFGCSILVVTVLYYHSALPARAMPGCFRLLRLQNVLSAILLEIKASRKGQIKVNVERLLIQ